MSIGFRVAIVLVFAYAGWQTAYEVLIDGRWKMSIPFWLRVPPNRIIDRTDNPTNHGVVCFTPEAGILCFVRPAES